MQSGQMKIVKDGDTVHVMPEMKQIGEDFNQFTREADKTVAKLKQKELETAIKKSGIWTGEEYNVFSHNCQDFVRFCLLAVGCPESMANKKRSIYREQNECVIF